MWNLIHRYYLQNVQMITATYLSYYKIRLPVLILACCWLRFGQFLSNLLTKRSLDSRNSSFWKIIYVHMYNILRQYLMNCFRTSMHVKHCHYRLIWIRSSLTYFHFHDYVQNVVVKSKNIHQINSLPDSYASDKVECLHLLQWLSDQQITYKIYLILSNSFSYII